MAPIKLILVAAFFILEVIAAIWTPKLDPVRLNLIAAGLACLAGSMLF